MDNLIPKNNLLITKCFVAMISHQCPQLQQLSDPVRKFWEDKQKEVEDTLIRFSYAVLWLPTSFLPLEKGGILYLMQTNLWFEDFPKPQVFFLPKTSQSYEKTRIQIPLAEVENVEVIRQAEFEARKQGKEHVPGVMNRLLRLFGSDPLYLFLTGKHKNSEPFQYLFRDLDDPDAWLHTLQK